MDFRPPRDNKSRDRIRVELDRNLVVEAGAGSGKTTVLIGRILETVLTCKIPITDIAAVTFTRKAAAELRERLQDSLEKAAADGDDRAHVARHALMEIDRAFVGTIHSFCARLLRERPVEAGLNPDFEEIEEAEAISFATEAWEEFLVETDRTRPELLGKLREVGISPRDLKRTYGALVENPDVEYAAEAVKCPDHTIALQELRTLVESIEPLLPQDMPEGGWDQAQEATMRLVRAFRYSAQIDRSEAFDLISLFAKPTVTQKKWNSKPDGKLVQELITAFSESHAAPLLRTWREYRYQFAIGFVNEAAVYCRDKRRKQSRLTFQDLLMLTAKMLREHPQVRKDLRRRYPRIFVDEFQDTDPIQAEILFLLTGENTEERDWRKLSPVPGALFIVGDPKQSIYRFRRADISIYNLVKTLLKNEHMSSEVLLTSNFRSDASVLDRVNKVFQEIFPEEADEYQASFARLDSEVGSMLPESSGVRRIVLRDVPGSRGRLKESEVTETDAELVARFVRGCLDSRMKIRRTDQEVKAGLPKHACPGDFMILLYRKATMAEYGKALEKYAIPYTMSGGKSFTESEDLLALRDLFLCLVDPADQIRLFKVLRGKLFGISDDVFYRFKKEGGYLSFRGLPEHAENQAGHEALIPPLKRLHNYWELSQKLQPVVAVEKMLDDLGMVPAAASGELPGSRTGNLLKALELIRLGASSGSFAAMTDSFAGLLDTEKAEEYSIHSGGDDAVRLMNLHKAKGLEAPVVILAHPLKGKSHGVDHYVERTADGAKGFVKVLKESVEGYTTTTLAQPVGWEEFEAREMRFREAEENRLLYVAATRARQLLVMSTIDEKEERSYWHPVLNRLGTVQETDIPAAKPPSRTGEQSFDVNGLSQVLEAVERDWEKARHPGYATMSVTALAHKGAPIPPWEDSGRGQAWGRVIHRMLETCSSGIPADLESIALNLTVEEDLPVEAVRDAVALVQAIVKSALWQRMKEAEISYSEMPFSVKVEGGALGHEQSDIDVVLAGAVDLIFKEADGWVLVDYKTDAVAADLKPFVDYYRPQLEIYAKHWEEVSGEKVKEKILYFTHTGASVVL
jgi:ATP-dependent helicase/nuclease subunit A